jgi:hypothetical protein
LGTARKGKQQQQATGAPPPHAWERGETEEEAKVRVLKHKLRRERARSNHYAQLLLWEQQQKQQHHHHDATAAATATAAVTTTTAEAAGAQQ